MPIFLNNNLDILSFRVVSTFLENGLTKIAVELNEILIQCERSNDLWEFSKQKNLQSKKH